VDLTVRAALDNGRLVSMLHEKGTVLQTDYEDNTVRLHVRVPASLRGAIESMGGAVAAAPEQDRQQPVTFEPAENQ